MKSRLDLWKFNLSLCGRIMILLQSQLVSMLFSCLFFFVLPVKYMNFIEFGKKSKIWKAIRKSKLSRFQHRLNSLRRRQTSTRKNFSRDFSHFSLLDLLKNTRCAAMQVRLEEGSCQKLRRLCYFKLGGIERWQFFYPLLLLSGSDVPNNVHQKFFPTSFDLSRRRAFHIVEVLSRVMQRKFKESPSSFRHSLPTQTCDLLVNTKNRFTWVDLSKNYSNRDDKQINPRMREITDMKLQRKDDKGNESRSKRMNENFVTRPSRQS